MTGGESSNSETDTTSAAQAPDATQLVEHLLHFLGVWVDQYRTADTPAVVGPTPEELLIDREAIASVRKRKPQAVALDDWAGRTYAERRLRDRIFEDSQLFGEPAWDMLLDIALAESKGMRLSVTSVCIGSCVPSTTALRWLGILEEKQLIRKEDDFDDGRRSFVRLTEGGIRKVARYFEAVRELRRNGP